MTKTLIPIPRRATVSLPCYGFVGPAADRPSACFLGGCVYRELIVRPEGGLIIDTPGMREIQHWDSDQELDDAFTDVTSLSIDCHFRNCQHRNEPKCAVRKEIDSGRLQASRLAQFHQFMRQREAVSTQRDEDSWTQNRK